MIFTKKNYLMMIGGVVLVVLGFVTLSGGGVSDPVNEFSTEIFSFSRLWIAPLLIVAGLVLEFVAIMHKDKAEKE